jgi:hypothetical protein
MESQKQYTLLDLVQSVNRFAKNDTELVATVAHLINSGRVRLCGNFAGAKISFASPLDVFPPQTRPRLSSASPLAAFSA